eukprot:4598393-Pleurochrysis_carterae.AAC.1
MPPVAEVCSGGPSGHPLPMDETTDAETVPPAVQDHAVTAQGAGAGRNVGPAGRTPARLNTASCTPGEDPSRQL